MLMVANESTTLHNVTIPSLGIDRDLPPKGKVTLDVTFPASGLLRFYCKIHEALGMGGELPPAPPRRPPPRSDSREAAAGGRAPSSADHRRRSGIARAPRAAGCYATSSSANPVARL
jgi:hypothetical protein